MGRPSKPTQFRYRPSVQRSGPLLHIYDRCCKICALALWTRAFTSCSAAEACHFRKRTIRRSILRLQWSRPRIRNTLRLVVFCARARQSPNTFRESFWNPGRTVDYEHHNLHLAFHIAVRFVYSRYLRY